MWRKGRRGEGGEKKEHREAERGGGRKKNDLDERPSQRGGGEEKEEARQQGSLDTRWFWQAYCLKMGRAGGLS